LKISTAVIVGQFFGAAIGLVSLGKVSVVSPDVEMNLHNYAWWIVVTSHPYRHFARFFTRLAVGLALLLLLSPRLPI
jgi:hypothetical protein